MIYFNKAFFKIWKVDKKENYIACTASTGDKQEDGSYKNSSWNLRLVGKANVDVKEGDRITVTKGKVENIWDKEKQKSWLNVIVFELEVDEGNAPPPHIEDDDLPFN